MLLVMSTQGVLEVSVSPNKVSECYQHVCITAFIAIECCYITQNDTSKLLEMTWLRIEQFMPDFMKQLFPSVTPILPSPPQEPAPPETTGSPAHPPQPPLSTDLPLETVVVQEIPVTMTMDHVTGSVTIAATHTQTSYSPSRSPEVSPHASPPISSSPGILKFELHV